MLAAVAGWPQGPTPPPVDHSAHTVIDTPAEGPIPSLLLRLLPDALDGFNLFLETRNFRFTPQNVDSAIIANEGHAHLYINGQKVARLYSPWRHLPAKMFRDGINRLEVEFNANDHSIWGVGGEPIGADVLVDTLDRDGDPIVREEVRYALDWSWGNARPSPSGGWEVQTNLGYSLQVEAGRLVTRSLELIPCHPGPMVGPRASLTRWLQPTAVRAGHGSFLPNESRIRRSHEEDLAAPHRTVLDSLVVTDPEYCEAHYLIARATGEGPGSLSLELTGTWKREGSGAARPFRIETPTAFGRIHPLTASTGEPVSRSILGGLRATVTRSLGTMFDDLDFATTEPAELGQRVIRRLVAETQVVAEGA